MSDIKIKRAYARSEIGRYPASRAAMLDIIPSSVISACTSVQLAELLDAVWTGCQSAKNIALRDAMQDGAVWDGQRMREIAA
jgi:hypothetical protein